MGEPEARTGSCPECGAACAAGVKFCANCGTSLVGSIDLALIEALPAGTVVGTYRLLELLGEGGMGRVYVAEHVKLGRRVAMKILRAEFASNPIAVSRFFAEARAVNRISHENIVEITDFFEKAGGHNCYIMELLHGEDLGLRLLRDELPSIVETVEIGIQIASALTAVHAAGIIHRDLKPDNIFLIERGGTRNFVKLLDFGVAKLIDPSGQGISLHTTAAGQIIGTPEYMSPEQASGNAVDHRTDIYALGVILYELVTGNLPFRAKSFGELVIKHLTVPPRRPSASAQQPIPQGLDDLIMELLQKDAALRPQTMSEIEEILHEIHDGMDVPVQPRRQRLSGSQRIARPDASPGRGMKAADSGALRRTPRGSAVPDMLDASDADSAGERKEIRRTPVAGVPIVGEASASDSQSIRRTPVHGVAATAPTIDAAPVDVVSLPDVEELGLPPARSSRTWVIAAGAACVVAAALVVWAATRKTEDAPAPSPISAATPQPPPPPARVRIRFTSTPTGATVKLVDGGRTLGTTPFADTFPRGDKPLVVDLSKDGFAGVREQIDLASDGVLAASLTALPAVPPAPLPDGKTKKPPRSPTPPTTKQKPKPLDPGGTMDVFGK